MKKSVRYYSLDAWLRSRHGAKVQKIPLDAGSSCPNRDGKLSVGGCVFCNASGSGSGRGHLSLSEQWNYWRDRFQASDRLKHTRLFMGYLQAFSNTYGSAARLEKLLAELDGLPGLVGACVGTRPDCLDKDKMRLLASCPWPELWLEIGVQSRHDSTLALINRGHTAADAERAIGLAAEYGVKVCAHLMADLPGESPQDFLDTVDWLAAQPLAGVKLHNLYVPEHTVLEGWWRNGTYQPMDQLAYVALVAEALTRLPSGMVIHRLTADPAPGELLAPDWASQKGQTIRWLDGLLDDNDWWQGMRVDCPRRNPYQT